MTSAEIIFREIIDDFDNLALHYWHMSLLDDSPPSIKTDPYFEDARKCALWREYGWKLKFTPEFNDNVLNLRAKDLQHASTTVIVSASRESMLKQAFKVLSNDKYLSFPDALKSAGLPATKANESAIRAMAKTDIEKEQLKRNRKGRTPKE